MTDSASDAAAPTDGALPPGSEPEPLYYEDIRVGDVLESGWFRVERDEIVSFASRWDPAPFHLDEEAAKDSIFGALVACAPHIFAIGARLAFYLPKRFVLLAGLGGDGLQLLKPVYADTEIRLVRRFTAVRPSKSRPNAGIVSFSDELVGRDGEAVYATSGSVLVARRSNDEKA